MRLTDDQIRNTLAAMRFTAEERAKVERLALAGEPGARLVVYAAWRRMQSAQEG